MSPPSPILIGEESVNSKASSDWSHNKKLPDVSPKNFTSTPVPSTPTVTAPSICTASSISTASKFVVPSMSAFPDISKVVASNSPATVATPLERVNKSVSLVCPIVVPLTIILSTVKVVRVPRLVTLPCAAVANVPVKVPVTVRLSAIVVSEVVCPMVTAIP